MSEQPTPEEIRRVMKYLGSRTSERKTRSSRQNGKEGGRPLMPLEQIPCTCGHDDVQGHSSRCSRGRSARRRQRNSSQTNKDASKETILYKKDC